MKKRYPRGRHNDGVPYDEFDGRWPIDTNDMPLSVVLLPLCAAWAVGAFLTHRSAALRGLPLIAIGVVYLTFGLRSLRNQDWRERGWWEHHRLAARIVAGPWFRRDAPSALLGVSLLLGGIVLGAIGLSILTGAL